LLIDLRATPFKKLATLNPENIPVNVISIAIYDIMKIFFLG
jgi:hypothetical protein